MTTDHLHHDANDTPLYVGGKVVFQTWGGLKTGRIYKTIDSKIYITTRKKGERPYADSYKDCGRISNVLGSKPKNSYVIKIN